MPLVSKTLSNIKSIKHGFLSPEENPPENFIRAHQVHDKTVIAVSSDNVSQFPSTQADGLITAEHRAVAVQTADCLPVLYSSDDGLLVAAIHAGWRGLHKGILVEAVRQFNSRGYSADKLRIAIGPAIGPCCFEVNQEVQNELS